MKLALLALLMPAAALACGVSLSGNGLAIQQKWVARNPVAAPPSGWAEWRAAIRWRSDWRACKYHKMNLEWLATETIDCSIGKTSAQALCEATGASCGKHRRGEETPKAPCARRIPQAWWDSLALDGYKVDGRDPGSGAGSGEHYVLIEASGGSFCLVHGAIGQDPTVPARAQLARFGVTDPELLALAWDRTPQGPRGPARTIAWLLAVLAVAMAFRTRGAGVARCLARIAVALALAGSIPALAEPDRFAGLAGGALVFLVTFAAASLAVAVLQGIRTVLCAVKRFVRPASLEAVKDKVL